MASLCRRFNASCASRLRVVWQPSSLVSLLLPVSACRPVSLVFSAARSSSATRCSSSFCLLHLLLLASCALLVTTSSRRFRPSSPSCRCASDLLVSFGVEIASSSPPTTNSHPLSRVLPPSAGKVLNMLSCLHSQCTSLHCTATAA